MTTPKTHPDTPLLAEPQPLAEPMELTPHKDHEYSGRFLVRLPKSLHKALAEAARAEGVSLNQYILYKLAR